MTLDDRYLNLLNVLSVFQVEDSGLLKLEGFGEGVVAEAPQGVEEGGAVAEEASEEGGRSWLSHTDMKVFILLFL